MHQNKNCIIDTEPLVLYILWLININLVWKFQKLKGYNYQDFFELHNFISKYENICVSSQVWNEFSHHTLESKLFDQDKTKLIYFLREWKIWDTYIKLKNVLLNEGVYYFWFADISCYELAKDLNSLVITSDWQFADFLNSNWIESYKFRPILWFNDSSLN